MFVCLEFFWFWRFFVAIWASKSTIYIVWSLRFAKDNISTYHRENTRREESKYLECENRQLGLSAIATYIFKPPTEKFKIGR